ncbi:MAG: RNA 2',3'-cyclic phosphodiesterase [Candidatus Latescibacterota bacterium]|nr:MAG: RNA 2',3'-cyclic phosphodiesterase [Candidatus Latescibacterota bacterium]
MSHIRTFVAVDISDEARGRVRDLVEELKQYKADVRWVAPESLHLTLKFLGEIDEGRLEDVFSGVEEAVSGVEPFRMVLEGLGGFPGLGRPRVLWVGVSDGAEELRNLAARVEGSLEHRGFPREDRPFSPHLTIGRVKRLSGRLRQLTDAMRGGGFGPEEVRVEEVKVMKSDLRPSGAVYTTLRSFPLRG